MRAWLVVLLVAPLLAPMAHADAGRGLVVTLRPGAHVPLPAGAIPLASFAGFVLPHASAADAARWREDPRALRVDLAQPLELAQLAGITRARAPSDSLRLTRATDAALASFGADGAGVTVAVLDSGVDATHPDLVGRVVANLRLVDGAFLEAPGDLNGHGTHVAGIVAASGASDQGAATGTAPGARILGLDILSESFTTTSALVAYDWIHQHHAERGIKVVVNAWGRVGDPRTFDPEDPLIRAIDRVVDDGVVVVFSATNHGPAARSLSVEAQDPRVVTVGAVDDAAILATYSSRGPVAATVPVTWTKPDVVAPGEEILGLRSQEAKLDPTTDPDTLHRVLSGTSQAAPHVAGVIARMLQANASLGPLDVLEALHASALDLGPVGPDAAYGYGLLDAPDAMRAALHQPLRRDNPLAAGGTETYEDAVTIPATRSDLLGFASAPDSWTTRFPVKPGATRLSFEIDAPALRGDLVATLLGPRGEAGTWSEPALEGGQLALRGTLPAPPAGVWTLRLRASLPLDARIASHVHVDLGANATRSLPLDARYKLPDDLPRAHGPTLLQESARLLHDEPWLLLVLPAGAGAAALAWTTRRRRTQDSSDEPT